MRWYVRILSSYSVLLFAALFRSLLAQLVTLYQSNMGAKNHGVIMPDCNRTATLNSLVRTLSLWLFDFITVLLLLVLSTLLSFNKRALF